MTEDNKTYCEYCGDLLDSDTTSRYCCDECQILDEAEHQDEMNFQTDVYYGRC